MDETRATARLEQLTIEVTHRRPVNQNAETLTISVTARPNFAVAAETIRAQALAATPWAVPFAGWMRLMGLAWRPWLTLMAPAAVAAAAWTQDRTAWGSAGDEIRDAEYRDLDKA